MMSNKAVFEGLVIDENDQPVRVVTVGDDPCYVVDDDGFHRHIPAEQVDQQVLNHLQDMIVGHEDLLSEQAAKMLGQDDIFSRAMIENQIKNMQDHIPALLKTGIPEETRAYLGMMGFKIRINVHGEVLDIEQPGIIDPTDED